MLLHDWGAGRTCIREMSRRGMDFRIASTCGMSHCGSRTENCSYGSTDSRFAAMSSWAGAQTTARRDGREPRHNPVRWRWPAARSAAIVASDAPVLAVPAEGAAPGCHTSRGRRTLHNRAQSSMRWLRQTGERTCCQGILEHGVVVAGH